MLFINRFAVISSGLCIMVWLILCLRLGFIMYSSGDMSVIFALGVLAFPSSLISGGVSQGVAQVMMGHQNLYFDFFFVSVGGLIEYAIVGIALGNFIRWLVVKLSPLAKSDK